MTDGGEERKKPEPTREREWALEDRGFRVVAGVDEVGRGPLAGPVVAAACVIPPEAGAAAIARRVSIRDSKRFSTDAAREKAYDALLALPGLQYAVAVVGEREIDRLNIRQATLTAMRRAVEGLPTPPDYVLVDGDDAPADLPGGAPSEAVVGGDASVLCIAAASMIAKVTRDRMMRGPAYEGRFPMYGFAKHKGYGTPQHLARIREHGPCPVHRLSFAPMRGMHAAVEALLALEEGEGEAAEATAAEPNN